MFSFFVRNLSVQIPEGNLADSGPTEHWAGDGGPQPKRAKVRSSKTSILPEIETASEEGGCINFQNMPLAQNLPLLRGL